jgi:hypothetical protein
LVSSLKFQKLKDYELAWVDAIVKTKNVKTDSEVYFSEQQRQSATSLVDYGLSLHINPALKESSNVTHKTVFVNEPKLSDLKQIFAQNSIQAEFHGGVVSFLIFN